MAEHTEIEDLLESYAIGGLPHDALEDVEAHLDECPICQAEVKRLRSLTTALRLGVPLAEPPPELRSRLLVAAKASLPPNGRVMPAPLRLDEARAPRRIPRVPIYWVAAAALLPLLLCGWLGLEMGAAHTSLRTVRAEAQASMDALRAEAQTNARRAWSQTESVAEVMGRGILVGAGTALVDGTENAPRAGGMLYYLPTSEDGVLVVDGLPVLPQGQCYQVWLFSGEKSMNGGTFYLGADGRGIWVVKSPTRLEDIDLVRITMEPHGGSEEPRGNRYGWARLKGT